MLHYEADSRSLQLKYATCTQVIQISKVPREFRQSCLTFTVTQLEPVFVHFRTTRMAMSAIFRGERLEPSRDIPDLSGQV